MPDLGPASNPAPTFHSLIPFIATPSPGLRVLAAHYKETLASHVFENVVEDIKKYFNDFTAELLRIPQGMARADHLHQMMDLTLQASSNMEKSCKMGCGGCCHYEVEVTRDEGELLAETIRHGVKIDIERLKIQAARERRSTEWLKFWNPSNRCVFLGDNNACQIYEYRPAICRKHSVISPAENCTTDGADVVPVEVPLAEILLSAALSIENTGRASLSKMLLSCMADQNLAESSL